MVSVHELPQKRPDYTGKRFDVCRIETAIFTRRQVIASFDQTLRGLRIKHESGELPWRDYQEARLNLVSKRQVLSSAQFHDRNQFRPLKRSFETKSPRRDPVLVFSR